MKYLQNENDYIMRLCFRLLVLSFLIISETNAQRIATLEVDVSKKTNGLAIPASVELDKLTFASDSSLILVEVSGNRRMAVPFQVSQGNVRTLNWVISPSAANVKKRVYELQQGTSQKFDEIRATLKDGALTIHSGTKNFLQYWYKTCVQGFHIP